MKFFFIKKHLSIRRFGILISIVLAIAFGIAVLFLATALSFCDLYYLLKVTVFSVSSIFLVYMIQRKQSFYLPSFYLFCFFSLIPIVGIQGCTIYRKLYGDYAGVYLDMDHAVNMWLQGRALFFLY